MYKKYLRGNRNPDEFAAFNERLDQEKFAKLLNNFPPGITSKEITEFNVFDGVGVAELEASIK